PPACGRCAWRQWTSPIEAENAAVARVIDGFPGDDADAGGNRARRAVAHADDHDAHVATLKECQLTGLNARLRLKRNRPLIKVRVPLLVPRTGAFRGGG